MSDDVESAARQVAEIELQRINALLGTSIRIASSQRLLGAPGVTLFFTDEVGRPHRLNVISVVDGAMRAQHGLTLARPTERLEAFRASLNRDDLRWLIPRNKGDFCRAYAVVAVGYPAVEPILPSLLEWVQDMNWPIAWEIAAFLSSIGAPLVPYIRPILDGNDEGWKYWIVNSVIGTNADLFALLKTDLERMAANPTSREKQEGVDEEAIGVLARGPSPWKESQLQVRRPLDWPPSKT